MSLYITQGLRRAAALWPTRTCLADGDRAFGWGETVERVSRFAGALAGLGLKAGDRVAFLGENTHHILEFYMAAPWAGLIGATINTRWAEAEMVYALEDSGASVLIADDHFVGAAPELARRAADVTTLIHAGAGPPPEGMLSLEALMAGVDPLEDALRGEHETTALFFTGGTTGRSKGVMLSPATLVPTALQVQIRTALTADSVLLHAAPLFHMAAGGMSYAAFGVGATQAVVPRFEPGAVLAAVEKYRATHVLWVPTMLQMILDHPDFDKYDLSSLRRIVYGAAPMPEALLRQGMERIPSAGFVQMYGMTELSPIATDLQPEDHDPNGPNAHRLRSAGQPSGGVDLRIVSPDGNDVARGETGEVIVRSPGVMEGYWGQPELTAEAVRDGWMHTGDAGYLDEDGYLYVVDRIKDMIISGGENIFSAEVENAIYKHPAVQECAVVGLPDPKWGEIVCAYVRRANGTAIDEAALMAHCQSLIAPFKCPKRVVFAESDLPKTGAGKIQKTEIRKMLAGE